MTVQFSIIHSYVSVKQYPKGLSIVISPLSPTLHVYLPDFICLPETDIIVQCTYNKIKLVEG
jgi:hypothetical protein